MGFIVYNEHDVSDAHPAARGARRRHPAERHVARVGLPGLRRRVQFARRRRLLRPAPTAARAPVPLADVRRHRCASTATPGRPSTPSVLDRDPRRLPRRRRLRERVPPTTSSCPITSAVWSTGAGPDRSTSRSTTCSASWTTTASSATATALAWRTIQGGSHDVCRPHRGVVCRAVPSVAGDPVLDVTRDEAGVTVRTGGGPCRALRRRRHRHPRGRRACACCTMPTAAERAALGGFDYSTNQVVLHTDAALMPRRRGAWASWNVDQDDCAPPGDALTMTYHMNRLQSLPGPIHYFVSVNPGDRSRPRSRSSSSARCSHPMYTFRTLEAQAALARLQGHRGTYYAGAHLGYGFHEDGCRSGFEAAGPGVRRADGGARRMRLAPAGRASSATAASGRSTTRWSTASSTSPSTSTSSTRSPRRLRLLSRNRRNAPGRSATTTTCDPPADDVRASVPRAPASRAAHDPAGWQVTLVTQPRGSSGYVFNPASFFLCRDATGRAAGRHRRGPQHPRRAAPVHAPSRQRGRTAPVVDSRWTRRSTSRRSSRWPARYTVRVRDEPERLRITINEGDATAASCYTSLVLTSPHADRPDAAADARCATRWSRHKTIGMIHWHALRLWLRGARFHRHRGGHAMTDAERSTAALAARPIHPGPARLARSARRRLTAVAGRSASRSSPAGRRAAGRSATRRPRTTAEIQHPRPGARSTRLLVDGETGGGEAYMDGLWSSPDLAGSAARRGAQPRARWPCRPAGGGSRPSSDGPSPTASGATRERRPQRTSRPTTTSATTSTACSSTSR